MPVRRLSVQPQQLAGHEYHDGNYEWLELYTNTGDIYAVCGISLDHPTEMWAYWRILMPSVAAWRDLKREVIPYLRGYAKNSGKAYMVVQTDDPGDTHFTKMVELMGFNNHRVTLTSWQEV